MSRHREANLREAMSLMGDLPILEFDIEAALKAGRIHAGLSQLGETIGVEDELIAGIAMRYGETLVTRNASHFKRIPGLKTEAWSTTHP
jgi:tRNA(fMet)-specific endonuclease VapC